MLTDPKAEHDWREMALRYKQFGKDFNLTPTASDGGWSLCPSRLVGRRCNHFGAYSMCRPWMERYHSEVIDHVTYWKDQDGRYVITTEPYSEKDHDGSLLARFIQECNSLNIAVDVEAYPSPHNPGRCLLIILRSSSDD